jgi:hypothetical protein
MQREEIASMPKSETQPATGVMLPTRKLAERYDVTVRTIERWVETGVLAAPQRINGRRYWPEGTTPRTDPAAIVAARIRQITPPPRRMKRAHRA